MRVGLLAYGAIGHEHNHAVQNTDGLELTAVCDVNPERIAAARKLAPEVAAFANAEEMLDGGYRKKYLRATSRLLALTSGRTIT